MTVTERRNDMTRLSESLKRDIAQVARVDFDFGVPGGL
jgi:hypothetical protein